MDLGQAGTLGFADFRPTVDLARSVRYWDNMTDDDTVKRMEEENRPPLYGDAPVECAGPIKGTGDSEEHLRRKGSVIESMKHAFHRSKGHDVNSAEAAAPKEAKYGQ